MTALSIIQGQLNPLKNVDPKDILDRYLKEETSTQIAKSYGVTRAALSFFMLKYAEEEWKDAQVTKALQRKEKAEDAMETADNPLDLARAREMLKAAQWDLERVCRRIYGQDVTPDQLGRVSITLNIGNQPTEKLVERPVRTLDLARSPNETHSHVQPQQYDSGAPQHEPITSWLAVDKSPK